MMSFLKFVSSGIYFFEKEFRGKILRFTQDDCSMFVYRDAWCAETMLVVCLFLPYGFSCRSWFSRLLSFSRSQRGNSMTKG